MRTAIVILNWNTRGYLEEFLPPLAESVGGLDAELIVADNGSTDGSLEMLSKRFPFIRTMDLGENFGFTGGYNRAFRTLLEDEDGRPEYLVLINSDILVGPGWLDSLVGHLDSHPDCGACGPKLRALVKGPEGYAKTDRFEYAGAAGGYLDRFGFPFCRGRVLSRTEIDRGQYDSPCDVFWVSGACFATRASLWEELGGLDERFFAHMEEIDYCWRLQLSGRCISVVPESCVYHLGGGTLPQTSPFKLMLNYRNGLLMLDNNLAATIGPKAAGRRIMMRRAIDNCAAAAYLLMGRFSLFKAVRQAHAEYGRLRKEASRRGRTGGPEAAGNAGKMAVGLWNICIITQALFRAGGVFDYLRAYENNH